MPQVKPYGWTSQYAESKGVSRWYDCAAEELTDYAARGCKTRILYHYVDHPILYTHPAPPSELVKTARAVIDRIDQIRKTGVGTFALDAELEYLRTQLAKVT